MFDNQEIPDRFRPAFQRARQKVESYFNELSLDPEEGAIYSGADRYLMMRAESMSVRFFELVRDLYRDVGEREAYAIAHSFLFDFSHAIGRADAEALHDRFGLESPYEKLAAGPVHFAYTGWAIVNLLEESHPVPGEDFLLIYEHEHSFESEAWLASHEPVDFPICVMSAGYSSGWCSASFDLDLVAAEITCRACGDEACHFVMAPPEQIEAQIERHVVQTPELAPRADEFDVPSLFDRKKMEAKLRTQNEQLARADRLASLGTLAAGIAHEVNNPLAFIISNLEYSLEALDEHEEVDLDEVRRALTQAKTGAERVKHTVRDLRKFSHGGLDDRIEEVDVEEILELAIQMVEKTAIQNGGVIITDYRDHPPARANQSRLSQVFVNLLVNAAQSLDPDDEISRIDVATGTDQAGRVTVTVADTGIGIPQELLDRIFDPFFTTKPVGEGTGIGLAICHQIIEAVGGTIEIDSEVGEGTTVRVTLPVAEG